MIDLLATFYVTAVSGLSLFGLLGLATLALYWRHRSKTFPLPAVLPDKLPPVTVQLPLFNERYVVDQLIKTAVRLDYPREKLQIQILDDSTDDTTSKALALITHYRGLGFDVSLLHRKERTGYKAGALADALPRATGDFIAVFDADFQPPPDFLKLTIPYFLTAPKLGIIQTRWSHLNAETSPLTAAQAIALDKHFAMEQTVRHRADLFPKFNGSGGVWRNACLVDAGGWLADTVCEDLCLSTRAILKGWEFQFLNDVTAPAQLPSTMSAYKIQQARWALGSFQCLRKYGRAILTDRSHSPFSRLYALLSMSAYATQPMLIMMLLALVPLLAVDYPFPPGLVLFSLAGLGQPLLFILAQHTLYPDWQRRLLHFPTLLLIGIGLAPSTTRAMIQALHGRPQPFHRTPKNISQTGSRRYPFKADFVLIFELFLAVYSLAGLITAWQHSAAGPLFFFTTCLLGFTGVTAQSIYELVSQI